MKRFKYDIQVNENEIKYRNRITYVLNSGKFTVITVDCDKKGKRGDGSFIKCQDVNIGRKSNKHGHYYETAHIYLENGEDLKIVERSCKLHEHTFDYRDVKEMAYRAKLPTIETNVPFVLVRYSNRFKFANITLWMVTVKSDRRGVVRLTDEEMEKIKEDATEWLI